MNNSAARLKTTPEPHPASLVRRRLLLLCLALPLLLPGASIASEQPSSVITAPSDLAMLRSPVCIITGTGSGTGLKKVEVGITRSGGQTEWRLATGTAAWEYFWTLPSDGDYAIQSRATDGSDVVETPGPGIAVTVACNPMTKSVLSWGDNDHGQLGDGLTYERLYPVQNYWVDGATALAAGYYYTLALKPDGTVAAWGSNYYGQLGDGTTTDRSRAVQVSGLSGAVKVAAGFFHAAALKSDGTVRAWGSNYCGQLGDGTTTERHTPVQVSGLGGVIDVACGSYYHSAALKSDGTVWAWGGNFSGELGDGTTTNRNTPVQVKLSDGSTPLGGIVAVAAGSDHTVALKSDGTVWAWGANYFGQLGDGTNNERHNPVQVSGLTGVMAISSGENHVAALKSDGTVWAWGYNAKGQLGDGTTTNRNAPVQVRLPGWPLDRITAVSCGSAHTAALDLDGKVWAWGSNFYGQLGDGTTTDRYNPVQVPALTDIVAVSSGGGHTASLRYLLTIIPPTSLITAPENGSTVSGVICQVSGTATDGQGGYHVERVEVSTDGGHTWNRADGTYSWSYDWVLPVSGTYILESRAVDSIGDTEDPGAGVSVTVAGYGSPELQHYSWDPSISGGSNCSLCHATSGVFLLSDFRRGDGFCQSCHNAAGVGHEKAMLGAREHPVMVNVTSGGAKEPIYGNITAGQYNNQPFSRLTAGHEVACITCHNPMRKYEDYGRTWEYTTTSDSVTYTLQRGGWDCYGSMEPKVYSDTSLWSGPSYSKTRKDYLVDPSEYAYDETAGTVTFKTARAQGVYVYVSLDYPYLRASSQDNRLCTDCHTENTHMGVNCLNCHEAHDTGNIACIRGQVRTTNHSSITVKFLRYTGAGSFADGGPARDGICYACHTKTKYYRRDGSGFVNHSGGVNYDGRDCTSCHSHSSGFAR